MVPSTKCRKWIAQLLGGKRLWSACPLTNSDCATIQWLLNKLERLQFNFKSYCFTVLDLIENEESLGKEQGILDDHGNRFLNLADRLQNLMQQGGFSLPKSATDPAQLLHR